MCSAIPVFLLPRVKLCWGQCLYISTMRWQLAYTLLFLASKIEETPELHIYATPEIPY